MTRQGRVFQTKKLFFDMNHKNNGEQDQRKQVNPRSDANTCICENNKKTCLKLHKAFLVEISDKKILRIVS